MSRYRPEFVAANRSNAAQCATGAASVPAASAHPATSGDIGTGRKSDGRVRGAAARVSSPPPDRPLFDTATAPRAFRESHRRRRVEPLFLLPTSHPRTRDRGKSSGQVETGNGRRLFLSPETSYESRRRSMPGCRNPELSGGPRANSQFSNSAQRGVERNPNQESVPGHRLCHESSSHRPVG